jgi:hypothetical protein
MEGGCKCKGSIPPWRRPSLSPNGCDTPEDDRKHFAVGQDVPAGRLDISNGRDTSI